MNSGLSCEYVVSTRIVGWSLLLWLGWDISTLELAMASLSLWAARWLALVSSSISSNPHRRPSFIHWTHRGIVSRHLILRALHVRHPSRSLRWGLRTLALVDDDDMVQLERNGMTLVVESGEFRSQGCGINHIYLMQTKPCSRAQCDLPGLCIWGDLFGAHTMASARKLGPQNAYCSWRK